MSICAACSAVHGATLGSAETLPIDARASDDRVVQPQLPSAAPAEFGPRADDVVLINTRWTTSTHDPAQLTEQIRCERFVVAPNGQPGWTTVDWTEFLATAQSPLPTVVYVHGNRVERGEDRAEGMLAYRAVRRYVGAPTPIRFLIWSWPSSQVRGPVRDFRLKAARTKWAGWQLAWATQQLPPDAPVSYIAYSLGARVVSGALHLMAGGDLDGLQLPPSGRTSRWKADVALIAPAVNADWLQPNAYHGRGLEAVDHLFVVANRRDPAMRFYRFGPTGRGAQALGFAGPLGLGANRAYASRVRSIDAARTVGRTHALEQYFAATPGMGHVLRDVVDADRVDQFSRATARQTPRALAERATTTGR